MNTITTGGNPLAGNVTAAQNNAAPQAANPNATAPAPQPAVDDEAEMQHLVENFGHYYSDEASQFLGGAEAQGDAAAQTIQAQSVQNGPVGVAQPTPGPAPMVAQPTVHPPAPITPGAPTSTTLTASSSAAPHILVEGSPEFHEKVNNALSKLSGTRTGRQLINGFKKPLANGNMLTIKETSTDVSTSQARLNARQRTQQNNQNLSEDQDTERATGLAQKGPATWSVTSSGIRRNSGKGEGANAVVEWNPNKKLNLDAKGRPSGVINENGNTRINLDGKGDLSAVVDDPNQDESHLTLAHEMIHARRTVKGTYTGGTGVQGDQYDSSKPAGKEELRAVGIGSLGNRLRVSENSIRKALGFQKRTRYKQIAEKEVSPELRPALGGQKAQWGRTRDAAIRPNRTD